MKKYPYALKMAFQYDRKEFLIFLVSSIFSGFILSFRKWGTEKFNPAEGIANFVQFTLLFFIIYFVFVSAQKYFAAYLGYECKYGLWMFGPVIGLMITFMTYGFVPFLYLGTVQLKEIPRLRLGKLRQFVKFGDLRWVGLVGPLAVLVLMVLIILPLYFAGSGEFFKNATWVAAFVMFFSSLPLPNTNGLNVFMRSISFWIGYFVVGIIMLALMLPFEFGAYIVALILTVIILWGFTKILKMHF